MGSAKKWEPEDELVRDALAKLIGGFDGSEREVSRRSGLNQSRLRTILDGTRAPASVGETIRIAEAIGHQASDVLRTIERAVAGYRLTHPGEDIPMTLDLAWPSGRPSIEPEGHSPDAAEPGLNA